MSDAHVLLLAFQAVGSPWQASAKPLKLNAESRARRARPRPWPQSSRRRLRFWRRAGSPPSPPTRWPSAPGSASAPSTSISSTRTRSCWRSPARRWAQPWSRSAVPCPASTTPHRRAACAPWCGRWCTPSADARGRARRWSRRSWPRDSASRWWRRSTGSSPTSAPLSARTLRDCRRSSPSGAIRAAVMEEQPFLQSRGFENELVRLVMSYIGSIAHEAGRPL